MLFREVARRIKAIRDFQKSSGKRFRRSFQEFRVVLAGFQGSFRKFSEGFQGVSGFQVISGIHPLGRP